MYVEHLFLCSNAVDGMHIFKSGLDFLLKLWNTRSVLLRRLCNGPLAQLVEQQTLNLWVVGSKPAWLKPCVRREGTHSLCESGETADTPDLGSGAFTA